VHSLQASGITDGSRKSEVVDDVDANVDPFGEKDPLRTNFHKCFPKGFTVSQMHVLCANVVKFG